jgi:DNA-binding IclR family transcriptional regulator
MASCRFERFTKNTIPNMEELKKHLRQVRSQGWAMDNQEYVVDHLCVGAPVYDYRGEIIAAVSASGTTAKITETNLPAVIREVKRTASRISRRLGYLT